MSFSIVPRLKDLALVVSLEDIMSKLLECHDYQPGERRPASVLDSPGQQLDPTLTREHIMNEIRNSLSYHLIGRVGVNVRSQYLKYYFNEKFLFKAQKKVPHPWMVLECVLDDSIHDSIDEKLAIPLDKNLNENDFKVIPTIARHSTKLKELEISFEYSQFPMATVEKYGRVIQSLSSLSHLTSLTLFDLPKSRRSVLKFIGKSCPLLSTFRLLNSPGSRYAADRDIVALILGESAHQFFPMDSDDDFSIDDQLKLEDMVVPQEMLTPICSTLQSLHLGEDKDGDLESGLVFALRHLPQLRKVGGASRLPEAIEILYDSLEPENVGQQPAVSSSRNFPGTALALSEIQDICVVSMKEDLLRLIGEKCRGLKQVSFDQKYFSESPERSQIRQLTLENVLNGCWPKALDSITFNAVEPEFVRLILKIFGPSLKHLTFYDCLDVDLSNLLPCKSLESLRIKGTMRYESTNLKGNPPSDLIVKEFLPQLKIIDIETCLGHWSRVFEENSGLTSVSLSCCHIGTSASIYPDCNSVPMIWPRLKNFSITQCSDEGFTMPMVCVMIPQLEYLKEITLPNRLKPTSFKSSWPEWYLRRYFWKSSPLSVYFVYNFHERVCSFLPKE